MIQSTLCKQCNAFIQQRRQIKKYALQAKQVYKEEPMKEGPARREQTFLQKVQQIDHDSSCTNIVSSLLKAMKALYLSFNVLQQEHHSLVEQLQNKCDNYALMEEVRQMRERFLALKSTYQTNLKEEQKIQNRLREKNRIQLREGWEGVESMSAILNQIVDQHLGYLKAAEVQRLQLYLNDKYRLTKGQHVKQALEQVLNRVSTRLDTSTTLISCQQPHNKNLIHLKYKLLFSTTGQKPDDKSQQLPTDRSAHPQDHSSLIGTPSIILKTSSVSQPVPCLMRPTQQPPQRPSLSPPSMLL